MTALIKSNSNIQAKDYVVVTESGNDYWYRVDRVTKNQYANTVVKRILMFHEIGAVPGVQD